MVSRNNERNKLLYLNFVSFWYFKKTFADYYSESSDDETKETVLDTKSAPEDSDMEIDETEDLLKHDYFLLLFFFKLIT